MLYWDRRLSHGNREGEVAQTFPFGSRETERAKRVLSADTETEAIDRALDMVIAEHERNRLAIEAIDRFVKSGIDIKDVYGTLGKIDATGSLRFIDLHHGAPNRRRSRPDAETVGRQRAGLAEFHRARRVVCWNESTQSLCSGAA